MIRIIFTTTQQTLQGTANSYDEEYCDEYIEEIKRMLYMLGLDLYDTDVQDTDRLETEKKDPYKIKENMEDLFNNLLNAINKNVNNDIKTEATSVYIKLILDKKILSYIESSNTTLKIIFNARKGTIDTTNITSIEDVSNTGKHGNGDYRLIVKNANQFPTICDLINQIINL